MSYNRLAKDKAAVLLVDHPAGLSSLVRDIQPASFRNNVLALADMWFAWRGDDVVVWDRETAAAEGCEIVKQPGGWWLVSAGRAVERLEQAGVMALVIQHGKIIDDFAEMPISCMQYSHGKVSCPSVSIL